MTIFIVSDRPGEPERLARMASELAPGSDIKTFAGSLEALAAARACDVDVALIEAALPELSGLDLGRYIQDLRPSVNLIYLSGDREHCFDAMTQHASGYLLFPVEAGALGRELSDLRHPVGQAGRARVFAQTFGSFELFVDGAPVEFKYSRTKEVVALLVNNRGAQTTNGEIIGALWEDDADPDKKASYLGNLRQDLQNTLKRLRATEIIVKKRGSLGIAVNRVECDLYDWLEKKQASKYRYLGDYMSQYSWAEYMHAELDEMQYEMEE